MQVTRSARRATRWVHQSSLRTFKVAVHRRNRRAVRQAIQAGKEPEEVKVTAWDIA